MDGLWEKISLKWMIRGTPILGNLHILQVITEGYLFLFLFDKVEEFVVIPAFLLFLLLCFLLFLHFLLLRVSAFCFSCFSSFSVLFCFSCFFACLLLFFSCFSLVCFSAFPLFAFPASLLFDSFASLSSQQRTMMWLTLWWECEPWQSAVTRKFSK